MKDFSRYASSPAIERYYNRKRNKNSGQNRLFFQACTCAAIAALAFAVFNFGGERFEPLRERLKNAIETDITEEQINYIKGFITDITEGIRKTSDKIDITDDVKPASVRVERTDIENEQSEDLGLPDEVWQAPCFGEITSAFGQRDNPLGEGGQFHDGVDIAVPENTEVRAVDGGVVLSCVNSDTYGIKLDFITDGGYNVFYAHLNEIKVKEGDRISAGQVVALSGNTGDTTGPHLHFGVHKNGQPVNPQDFVSLEE